MDLQGPKTALKALHKVLRRVSPKVYLKAFKAVLKRDPAQDYHALHLTRSQHPARLPSSKVLRRTLKGWVHSIKDPRSKGLVRLDLPSRVLRTA